MEETEDSNPTFWGYIKSNPLQIFPLIIIICVTMLQFATDNYILKSVCQIVVWISIGFQWFGIVRTAKERKLTRLEFDKNQLARFAERYRAGIGSKIFFLVPFHPNIMKRIWNKLWRQRVLSLYSYSDEPAGHSYTKIHLSTKDLFYLKLKHCINTTDGELALEGMKYLSKDDKHLDFTT